jgi:hypothetical protein
MFMQGKEKTGKAEFIGYGIGLAAFIVAVLWKFLVN